MAQAKEGSNVKVHYTGKFDDGTVFDSSEGREPIEFTVGEGKVIKGFDEAVRGMKEGDEKDIKIKPKDGYGEIKEELVQPIPRDKLPKDREPKKGMTLTLKAPNGAMLAATIVKVEDDKIFLDLNHPLAGKTLNFKIKVVEVK